MYVDERLKVSPRRLNELDMRVQMKKKTYESKTLWDKELADQRGRPDGGGYTTENDSMSNYMPSTDIEDKNYD